jgi:eukaryotic-like serine/threonine-protein kinase
MAEPHPWRERLVTATLGDYDILAELGRGGMATVYLAHDLALDRRVAIKVMAPELVEVEGMADRFLLEARTAAALSHPHIIPIHAVRRANGLLYFVMKYIEGRSLDAVLAGAGTLGVPVVRAILTQVGGALEAAHARGVVHRDIKPANILLDANGDAFVADFGIAKVAERHGATRVGDTVGTPAYMSPEQCSGAGLTGAADQYSLGVVAYELLTGAPPFDGDNLVTVVWRLVNEEVPPLAVRRPDCAGAVATAVHRMLAKRMEDRWPSVADAVAALGPLTLAPDDQTRAELRRLARSQPGMVRVRATPISPGVQRRVPSDAPTEVARAASAPCAAAPVVASDPGAQPARLAASLRLPAAAATLTIGDEVRLVASARDAAGQALEGAPVVWTTSHPVIAAVTPEGILTALTLGVASLTACCGEALATLALTVTRVGVRTLAVAPRQAVIGVGDTLDLTLTTREAAGQPTTRLVAWTSSCPAVAVVDGIGQVTARGQGSAEITAISGETRDSLTLRVTAGVIAAVNVSPRTARVAVGERVRFAAVAVSPRGCTLTGYVVRWAVSDPAVAAIADDGVLTAQRTGQVLVAARVEGRVGTVTVHVTPAPSAAPTQVLRASR